MYDLDNPPKSKLKKVKVLKEKKPKKVWANSHVEPTYLKKQQGEW